MDIYFIITGRNCGKYINDCFCSLLNQTSNNWRAVFVDDSSNDDSLIVANNFQQEYSEKFFIYSNAERKHKTYGFLMALELIPFNAVVAELDADDTLFSQCVVEDILNLHEKYDVVYTNHKTTNCSQRKWINWKSTQLPLNWSRNYPIRENVWDTSNFPGHLRTFKRHLFDLINKEDLYYNGELLKVAFDMVYYTILIEITPSDKIYFLDKEYYNYMIRDENYQFTEDDINVQGTKNFYKDLCQTEIDKWFKLREPYSKIY